MGYFGSVVCRDGVKGFGNPTHVCVCQFCSVLFCSVWFGLDGFWALSTAVYLCVPLQLLLVAFFSMFNWVLPIHIHAHEMHLFLMSTHRFFFCDCIDC